jgi:ArsR family transcriptional regulator
MSDIITTLKAINNPVRLDILRWLKEPKVNFEVADQLVDADEVGVCVSIIQEKAGLSQSTVSAYLATLQRAGLVDSNRVGPWTYYKRNHERVEQLLEELKCQL